VSEVQTNTAPESDRIRFNRRIREKRSKGHSSQMIAEYAADCPVPLDQLDDLTPEERTEVERLRPEVEKRRERRREDGEERDKDGRRVPAKIDYEAVKDIPAKDDAHRTTLVRLNQLRRLHEKGRLWGADQFVFGEVRQRATAYHEADPSQHFLEHCLRAWRETTGDERGSLYEQYREEERKRAEAEQKRVDALKPETLEKLFDALAKHNVATVEIEFQDVDGLNLSGSVENVLNAEGEEIDLFELISAGHYWKLAEIRKLGGSMPRKRSLETLMNAATLTTASISRECSAK
jgi:hypothetical protein